MENFFGIQSKKRDTGREPGGINLFRGLAFIAVGIIGISSIATPVPMMWKLIFGASGLIFGGIGGMWMKKYVSAYRAFRQFVPVWDRKRGMYDQFAEELNTWYEVIAHTPNDAQLSHIRITCPNCGGSFDAVWQKICPHCESEYHMENEGWVIDRMYLIW